MTAFSTFLPSLVSATSFICSDGSVYSLDLNESIWAQGSTNLHEDHGGDLLGGEGLGLAEVVDLDGGGGALSNDLEGPGLDILLDNGVIEGTTDQTPVLYIC